MQTYELAVRNRVITVESEDTTLVRTSRGVDKLVIGGTEDEWLGLDRCEVVLGNGGEMQAVEAAITPELEGADHPDWAWRCEVEVPDSVLQSEGKLAVTVHGFKGENHIITAAAWPLTVEEEGA